MARPPTTLGGGRFFDLVKVTFYRFQALTVVSGSPTAEPRREGEVHLVLQLGEGAAAAVRFKSSTALNELITALQAHRADVWGGGNDGR